MTNNRPAGIGDGNGRVVVVTGASSGIGLATAQQLALSGHRVVLGARRSMVCEEAAAKLKARGATATAVALDLTDPSSIDRFVEHVHRLFGPIDVLVSNAGTSWPSLSTSPDTTRVQGALDVNFVGPQHLVAQSVPAMIDAGQGDLIFVSSEAVGAIPRPWMSAYSASKHALEAWTGVLRAELEGTGVRVSVVRPGPTYTEQGTGWNVDDMQEMLAVWDRQGVMRHSVALQPEDVAGVIASMVDLPQHIHMRLVEVVPSIPRKVEVKN